MENIGTIMKRQTRLTHLQVGEINGKVPPQAVEVEKSVLGALMLDKDAVYKVMDELHEGLFYKTEHQVICEAIMKLAFGAHEVDVLTVVDELQKEGRLEMAGGAFYVSQLTSNVVSAAHMEVHLKILTEKYIQREVIRSSTESIREAYDETCDAIDLIDRSQKRLMEVSEQSFRRESTSLDSVLYETEKVLFSENQEEYSMPSGFTELDKITSGFQPGTLIILAARPGMGKTACSLTMARNMAIDYNKPVAFFSLEMTAIELMARLLSAEAEIPAHKLKRAADLTKEEREQLVRKMEQLRGAPLYIDDTSGIDIFQFMAKCRRLKSKYGIKMVFVDYLQLMTVTGDLNKGRNREQELALISRKLKELSKELNIPVLAMAQFARRADDRPMGIPLLSDLRESGSIEQDADLVIAVHRLEKCGVMVDTYGNSTEGMATLRILKHRSGDTGVVDLKFEGKYVRFSNLTMTVDSKINDGMSNNNDFDKNTGAVIKPPDPEGLTSDEDEMKDLFEDE